MTKFCYENPKRIIGFHPHMKNIHSVYNYKTFKIKYQPVKKVKGYFPHFLRKHIKAKYFFFLNSKIILQFYP